MTGWYEIKFGKDRYSQVSQMKTWCETNIGEGGWKHTDEGLWIIDQMFGNTFFFFKNSQDAVMFSLRWV